MLACIGYIVPEYVRFPGRRSRIQGLGSLRGGIIATIMDGFIVGILTIKVCDFGVRMEDTLHPKPLTPNPKP